MFYLRTSGWRSGRGSNPWLPPLPWGLNVRQSEVPETEPVSTRKCLRCSSRFSWLRRSALRSSHVLASVVGRSLTPSGFWRMGSGGNSSLTGLAVEYACLGWMVRLASGREESTDRSMTDHVLFAPFPYKQATTGGFSHVPFLPSTTTTLPRCNPPQNL